MKIFLYFILIVFSFSWGNATVNRIEKLKIFGVEAIDSLPKQYEQMVIHKIDTLRMEECVIPFFDGIEIKQKFEFANLPCLQMFAVEDGREGDIMDDSHQQFLFNACDSSVYPFGSDVVRFSKFMKIYLPSIVQNGDSTIKELVNLYVNTLNLASNYYTISNSYNFLQIWKDVSKIRPMFRRTISDMEMKNESMMVMHGISEFEVIPKKDHYEIYIATWEDMDGAVEEWRFCISKSLFELRFHRILFYHIGPYLQP